MTSATASPVAVIGAGIVGLCVAYELRKRGHDVLVIDSNPPGSQCSFGNAGAISAGSVAPLAMPGAFRNAGKMLLDQDAPLHIPFRYWLRAAPWLLQFLASANPVRVREIAAALQSLFAHALENHQTLAAEIGCPELVAQTGQLHLYRNEAALAKDAASWELRQAYGTTIEVLDSRGIRQLEPAVSADYSAGVFMPEQGAVLEPFRYATAIAAALQRAGGVFEREQVLRLRPKAGGWTLRCGNGNREVAAVVVAAGAWSAALLRPLGLRVPLESQRGYHVHVAQPGVSLSRPVVLADRKVFIAPMHTGLRIAGTVEFAGLAAPPNQRRARLLGQHAKEGLPRLDLGEAPSTWMGHRPCLPDSLPVVGPVPGHAGLWCAFGHGHLGMTGSINTGRMVAAAMDGAIGEDSLEAYSIARFQ